MQLRARRTREAGNSRIHSCLRADCRSHQTSAALVRRRPPNTQVAYTLGLTAYGFAVHSGTAYCVQILCIIFGHDCRLTACHEQTSVAPLTSPTPLQTSL